MDRIPGAISTDRISVEPLPFDGAGEPVSTSDPLVVVGVEPRLLRKLPNAEHDVEDLEQRLRQFRTDLSRDGYDARLVSIDLTENPTHQDGRGVLAIRDFFVEVSNEYPNFEGAVLVGSFPEAMLVRRWIWSRHRSKTRVDGTEYTDVDLFRIVPEVVAERSDIVLADLTGNWDELYREGPEDLTSIRAIADPGLSEWPTDGGLFTSSSFEVSTRRFSDFFWIEDDRWDRLSSPPGTLHLRTYTDLQNPEVSQADAAQKNPIARPDIGVSRIDARHVAVSPDPTLTDVNGARLVAADGKPQAVEFGYPVDVNSAWTRDPALERELLVEYFDRNHRFRSGMYPFGLPGPAGITSAGFKAQVLSNSLKKAYPTVTSGVSVGDATLLEYVDWLKSESVLRGIFSHADGTHSEFDSQGFTTDELEAAVGGRPWKWEQRWGEHVRYEPSLESHRGWADFHLHRTIWENDVLRESGPNVFIHRGCKVNAPANAENATFDDERYGRFQNAEGILFYLDGLAVVARAKDFNDWPKGVTAALGADANLGDGLAAYFETEAKDANLGQFHQAKQNKRAYPWSIVGDWTLELRYPMRELVNFTPTEVRKVPFLRDRWLLTDGTERIATLGEEAHADLAVEIIRHYEMTDSYVVGHPDPVFEYYLCDGEAPEGEFEDEQSVEFDSDGLRVDEGDDGWVVTDGETRLTSTAAEWEADVVVAAVEEHGFTHLCFVGNREEPEMTYLRR